MLFHSHALSQVFNTKFDLSPSRTETLTRLVCGVLGARTVNLSQLAAFDPGQAKVASAFRRHQRFFEKVRVDPVASMKALVALSGLIGPYQLCLDRTNWKFGQTDINYLVLCIATPTMRVPVLWKLLGTGTSNTSQCLSMVDMWLDAFGAASIEVLLADREFVSNQWFERLIERKVPFVIRLKDNHHVTLDDGRCAQLKALVAKPRTRGKLANRVGKLKGMKGDLTLRFVAKKPRNGDMIVVATHGVAHSRALKLYKQRWRIECMFADWKKRGLNIEDTHLRCPQKLSLLLLIVALASLWAQSVVKNLPLKQRPKKANHGYLRQSWFRVGWDLLRQWANQNFDALKKDWERLWYPISETKCIRVV